MKKRSLFLITLVCSVCLVLFACRKEIGQFVNGDTVGVASAKLEAAKIWNAKFIAKNISETSKLKGFVTLSPQWEKAWTVSSANGTEYLAVPTIENHVGQLSVAIRRLFLFEMRRDHVLNAQIVEFVGLDYNVERNLDHLIRNQKSSHITGFSGAVIHYDLNYRWTGGNIFEDGTTKYINAAITGKNTFNRPGSNEKNPLYLSRLTEDALGSLAIVNYKYLFSPSETMRLTVHGDGSGSGGGSGSDINGGELSEVVVTPPGGGGGDPPPTGGGGGGDYGGNPGGDGGGGGGSTNTEFTTTLTITSSGEIIQNMQEYLKCFSAYSPAIVNIYVKQPTSNSSNTWSGSPYEPNVGHTFVSIEQSGIVRVFGFYPDLSVSINPFSISPTAPALMRNDGGHSYDVKVTINVSGAKMGNILTSAKSYISMYNLNSYNCTDFAIDIANSTGFYLPDNIGYWPGGGGSNPGNLGQDIRGMNNSNNVVIKKTPGIAISNIGSCD